MNWKRGLIRTSVGIPVLAGAGFTFIPCMYFLFLFWEKLRAWQGWLIGGCPRPIKFAIMWLISILVLAVPCVVMLWAVEWVQRGFAKKKPKDDQKQ